MIAMFVAGVGIFVLGVGVFFYFDRGGLDSDWFRTLMPGLIAFLLAGLLCGAAIVMRAWRMLVFAAVLVVGGVVAAANDANPGIPLIPAGALAAVWGVVMLAGFVGKHPKVEPL